jgi:hypothetical protein
MSKVVAAITMSIDGYVTGPNDAPADVWATQASACTTRSAFRSHWTWSTWV